MTTYSATQLRALAKSAGLSDSAANIAGAIAMAESTGNTDAVNGHYVGLWQIGDATVHPEFASYNLHDPAQNAKAMVSLSRNGTDWSAWQTYTQGTYAKYLYVGSGFLGSGGIVSDATKAANDIPGVSTVTGAVSNTASVASKAVSLLGDLTQSSFWRRVGIGVVGVNMIIVAVVFLLADEIEGPKQKKNAPAVATVDRKGASVGGAEKAASEGSSVAADAGEAALLA